MTPLAELDKLKERQMIYQIRAMSNAGSAMWYSPGPDLAILSAKEYAKALERGGDKHILVRVVDPNRDAVYEITIDGEPNV